MVVHRFHRATVALVIGLAWEGLSAPALAQTAGDKAAAEALFEQGRQMVEQGRFQEACSKFEASQQLDPGIGTLLYLADCYERAGRYASAWATFREAAAAASHAGQTDRESLARELAAALEPKLSKLVIVVDPENPLDQVDVRRDGEKVIRGLWSAPIPVDAGKRRVSASAPGKKEWSTVVDVTGPGAFEVRVPVLEDSDEAPAAAPAPPPPEPAVSSSSVAPVGAPPSAPAEADRGDAGGTQRTIGWILGGAGVASLAVAGVFTLRAVSKDSSADGHCDADGCDAEGVRLGQEAQDAAGLATIFSAAGGVLAVSGVVLVLTAPSGQSAAAHDPTVIAAARPGFVGLEGLW